MRRIVVAMGLVLGLPAAAAAAEATQTAPAAMPLDGTAWAVKVTPDEAAMKKGEKVFNDVIMFQSGRVAMSECVKAGFKPSAYKAEKSAAGWSVSTEQMSEKMGTSVWTVEVEGDAIKGTLVTTKKDGTVLNYTFTGKAGKRTGN
jgi:hypothetical protein